MRRLLFVLLILVLVTVTVMAEGEEDPAQDDTVHIRAGHLEYTEDEIDFSNGIKIIKGENTVEAPRGKYFKEENRVNILDGVSLIHSDGEITSREMTAWLKEDRYVFRREVELKQRLEEEKSFVLNAPYLKLILKDNSFQARKGVIIKYEGRTIKGEEADYNDQEQTLTLKKNVYIEEENGDWVKSEQAVFYLETEEFVADGNVELEIDISSD